MQTRLNPYLAFKDTARQSIEFYRTVFGGNLTVQTFKEANASHTPTDDNLVMHAMLETDTGIVLMASDTPSGMEYRPGTNVSISLSGDNEAELRGYWDKLSEGATTTLPLEKAPWGDTFGMLTDKFGIQWMVNISAPKA
jgi:PhnB protein